VRETTGTSQLARGYPSSHPRIGSGAVGPFRATAALSWFQPRTQALPGSGRADHSSGGVQGFVRCMPAARPLLEITSAIFRDASSIISSPITAAPRLPPASDV
jgi:hypothetical protein